jgi:hypothetical protein
VDLRELQKTSSFQKSIFCFLGNTVGCCGDLKTNIVPFRNFESRDMSKQDSRKTLSDFKILMNIVEEEAKKKYSWKASMNISDANSTFYQVSQVLDIQATNE